MEFRLYRHWLVFLNFVFEVLKKQLFFPFFKQVTDKIREEMKELRNLSILFEKKLLIQKKNEMRFRDDVSETNSYLQVSSMIDHTKKTDIFIEIPEVPDDLGFLQKSPQPRLIRSNSYTLLNPSPMLLQHIKTLTTKNSTSLEEIQKVNTKSLVKQGKPSSVRKNLLNEISNKRSPYDSGKKNVPRKRISSAPTENQLKNVMTKVEDEHKSKLKQLLLSQQDEQARLKDSFTKQHSELLKQINHVLARKSPMISEGNNSYIDSDADSIFNCTRDKDPVESGFDSRRDCSRRLFSPESKTVEELRRVSFFIFFFIFFFGGLRFDV